jgi:diaminopimelate decarboxylase
MEIVSRDGHLLWGGLDVAGLAAEYGTPLYVMSEDMIVGRMRQIRTRFLDRHDNTRAAYASKAFLTGTMARIADREGLWLDVVSEGEMRIAAAAGFPMERAMLHGNSKSRGELRFALERCVGRVVVDNMAELEFLADIASRAGTAQSILLRVSPGVDSHTHRYIQTGGLDSKFGLPIGGKTLESAVKFALCSPNIDLEGLHFHLGSQLMAPESHILGAKALTSRLEELRHLLGYSPRELNIGGGFGVAFAPGERSVEIGEFLDPVMDVLDDYFSGIGERRPAVCIEPGRWIVSEAGITLYTVENVKEIPDVVTYVAVDGGMTDNPRPALYGARYSAVVANKMDGGPRRKVAIVGRCCESSDVLARDVELPPCAPGDVIALLSTGAYNHSMASNYNMILRPAVILISGMKAETIVRRETWDDLMRRDIIPKRLMEKTKE